MHRIQVYTNVILLPPDEGSNGFCNPEYQLSSRVRFNSTKLFCNRRGITNTIGSRVKGGNNTIVTVANSNDAFSQKIFIQKVIGLPTGSPMGFGFPHAIKRHK